MTRQTIHLPSEALTGALLLANAGLIVWAWDRLPARLPVHWNLAGEVDRWGGRLEALALVPLFLLGVSVLLSVLIPRLSSQNNSLLLRTVRLGLALLGLCFTAQVAFQWPPARGVVVGLGLFLLLIGNMMGKVQPSRWVGFRTPWTARSRLAWQRGQRRSGVLLVVFGLGCLLTGLALPSGWLFPWLMPVGFLLVLGSGLVWLVYRSYLDYRHDPHPETLSKS